MLHNGITTTTDYLDGFQYKNTVLEFFGHAEGFVANNSNILKYVFQYKDQVGNVRVSYAANQTGQATILEEIDEGDSSNTAKKQTLSEIKPLLPLWAQTCRLWSQHHRPKRGL